MNLMINGSPQGMFSILYILLIGVGFYFLIIRPNKKQQAKKAETMQGLKVGDNIVTISGVRGEVVDLNDVTFVLATGPDKTTIEFNKQALAYIVQAIPDYNESEEAIESEEESTDVQENDEK